MTNRADREGSKRRVQTAVQRQLPFKQQAVVNWALSPLAGRTGRRGKSSAYLNIDHLVSELANGARDPVAGH